MATLSIKSRVIECLAHKGSLETVKASFFSLKLREIESALRMDRRRTTVDELKASLLASGMASCQMKETACGANTPYPQCTANLMLELEELTLRLFATRSGCYCMMEADNVKVDLTRVVPSTFYVWMTSLRNHYRQWCAEWQALVDSCGKKAKTRSLNEIAIESLLKARLSGSGIRYRFERQQYRVKVTLTLNHNMQATFPILHSRFREQLDQVLSVVAQLNQVMDDLGQPVRIRQVEKSVKWIDSGTDV